MNSTRNEKERKSKEWSAKMAGNFKEDEEGFWRSVNEERKEEGQSSSVINWWRG